jgi:hypothetical protein
MRVVPGLWGSSPRLTVIPAGDAGYESFIGKGRAA